MNRSDLQRNQRRNLKGQGDLIKLLLQKSSQPQHFTRQRTITRNTTRKIPYATNFTDITREGTSILKRNGVKKRNEESGTKEIYQTIKGRAKEKTYTITV